MWAACRQYKNEFDHQYRHNDDIFAFSFSVYFRTSLNRTHMQLEFIAATSAIREKSYRPPGPIAYVDSYCRETSDLHYCIVAMCTNCQSKSTKKELLVVFEELAAFIYSNVNPSFRRRTMIICNDTCQPQAH
jgi:hypothetical protein